MKYHGVVVVDDLRWMDLRG